jgi:hypothetical protein
MPGLLLTSWRLATFTALRIFTQTICVQWRERPLCVPYTSQGYLSSGYMR